MTRGNRSVWVGFDLGGTKMLTAAYDAQWKELGRRRRKTKGRDGSDSGIQRIISTIERLLEDSGLSKTAIAGIGIGCPGPIDLDAGCILTTPNLGWDNVQVQSGLRSFEIEGGCRPEVGAEHIVTHIILVRSIWVLWHLVLSFAIGIV